MILTDQQLRRRLTKALRGFGEGTVAVIVAVLAPVIRELLDEEYRQGYDDGLQGAENIG
jgi:hypothetical protein